MSKGIIFYTDNGLPPKLAWEVQYRIKSISLSKNLPIVTAALKQRLGFGDTNIYFPSLKRGMFTLFKQILSALEHSTSDFVFFCEADILYHPSHFDFTPPSRDAYYYNKNNYVVWMREQVATHVDVNIPLSMLCGDRELLIGHFKRKIQHTIERQQQLLALPENKGITDVNMLYRQGVSKFTGGEPGGEAKHEKIDYYPIKIWSSEYPNIDLRHETSHLSRGKRYPRDYHHKEWAKGWGEFTEIPGWGKVSDIVNSLE